MSASSSEQEGKEIAAEIAARPNLTAVVDRMLVLIEELWRPEQGRRRESLKVMVGCLGTDLRPGEDISDRERDEWLKVLVE
jgi:hypothetical protein